MPESEIQLSGRASKSEPTEPLAVAKCKPVSVPRVWEITTSLSRDDKFLAREEARLKKAYVDKKLAGGCCPAYAEMMWKRHRRGVDRPA